MDVAVCEEGGHTWRATQGRKSTIKTDDSFTDPLLRYQCIHVEGGATLVLRSSENIHMLPRLGRVYVGLYSTCCACYVLVYQKRPEVQCGLYYVTYKKKADGQCKSVRQRKQRQTNRQAAEDVSFSYDVWPEVIYL